MAFLLISVGWNKLPVSTDDARKVEDAIGNFGEWFRFSPTTWILSTEMSDQVLYGSLKTILARDHFFLITGFDPDDFVGWGPASIEEWLEKRLTVQQLLPPPK